jgi:hypothetical protein
MIHSFNHEPCVRVQSFSQIIRSEEEKRNILFRELFQLGFFLK